MNGLNISRGKRGVFIVSALKITFDTQNKLCKIKVVITNYINKETVRPMPCTFEIS